MTERALRNEYRTTQVCVDDLQDGRFRGRLYNPFWKGCIRFNGVTNLFYRSFQPLVKWRDRKERLAQPFELVLGNPDKLIFIDEDWTVEGDDPKLTPKEIAFAASADEKYAKIDTCFIYAEAKTTVARICEAKGKLASRHIVNWYVFGE